MQIENNNSQVMEVHSNSLEFWDVAWIIMNVVGIILAVVFLYLVFFILFKVYKKVKDW